MKRKYYFLCNVLFIYLRLVCGDVEGNFKALFTKVAVIQKKKGPFDVSMN